MNRIRLLSLLAVANLSACSLIPGTHLSFRDDQIIKPESPGPMEYPVEVRQITPDLVMQPDKSPVIGSPEGNVSLLESINAYEYRIHAGDVLAVTVWDHPEFSASVAGGLVSLPSASANTSTATPQATVTAPSPEPVASARAAGVQVQRDGTIFLAYAGKVKVLGKTIPAAREAVTKALSKYIRDPQVDVAVTGFNSQRVYLTGDIGKSGTLPVTTEPLTLFDAVTRIGLAPTPDLEQVVLIREGRQQPYSLEKLFKQGDANQNVLLRHGDVLNFTKNASRHVYLLGEVGGIGGVAGSRGKVAIGADGLTLGAALAQAGGISELTARPTGVFVMRAARNESNQPYIKIFQLDATNATAYLLADQFKLEQRDFVYVTAAPVVRFNRVMSQILPFAANFLFFNNLGR